MGVTKLSEKVSILGLNKQQEKVMLETLVEFVVNIYVDDTRLEFSVMSANEQLERLEKNKERLKRKKLLSERRFAREQQNLSRRLDRIERQMGARESGKSGLFRSLFQSQRKMNNNALG